MKQLLIDEATNCVVNVIITDPARPFTPPAGMRISDDDAQIDDTWDGAAWVKPPEPERPARVPTADKLLALAEAAAAKAGMTVEEIDTALGRKRGR